MAQAATPDPLLEALEEIRQRVEARRSSAARPGEEPVLPDLIRLMRSRDAAFGKVAAIGTVNPRHAGFLNDRVQSVKRLISRGLSWFVREQVEFNHATVVCVEETIEALETSQRAIHQLHERLNVAEETATALRAELNRQQEFEVRIARSEIQFLKNVAEMEAAFQHRVSLLESSFKDTLVDHRQSANRAIDKTHADFEQQLRWGLESVEKRMWEHLGEARGSLERLIHQDLRILRQRAAIAGAGHSPSNESAPAAAPPQSNSQTAAFPFLDWLHFAARFRGDETDIEQRQEIYLPYVQGVGRVIDLGCGRGEFLRLLKRNEINGLGVDSSAEMVALCHSQDLEVERADLFEFLDSRPDGSLDCVFSCQVIEHLTPQDVPRLVQLAVQKLRTGGLLILETPDPGCLAIYASHFFIDPTHTRPIPQDLLAFYLEEAGFGKLELKSLHEANRFMPSLDSLPGPFREAFFGGMDYAIIGHKL